MSAVIEIGHTPTMSIDQLSRILRLSHAGLERVAEMIVASLPENALSALTTCRYGDERSCIDCPMEVFRPLETPGSSTTAA